MLSAFRGSAACSGIAHGVLHGLLVVLQQQQTASSLLQGNGFVALQHAVGKLARSVRPLQPWTISSSSSRSMQTDARLPLERLQEAITPEVCAELNAKVRSSRPNLHAVLIPFTCHTSLSGLAGFIIGRTCN
jgi:hypothetical protein